MAIGISSALLAVGAGFASLLSPCVLPVVPIVMAGGQTRDRLRPLLVVLGLSITFMTMGAVSSLFGSLLIGRTRTIEMVGAFIITGLGVIVMFDLSFFKRLSRLTNIRVPSEGRFSGLLLGLALGLIWVPCVGPFLSSILALVGTSGQLLRGVVLLGFYSLGLAIPMLLIAYSSHLVRSKFRLLAQHESKMRYLSGGILVSFGLYSMIYGNIAF